MARRPLMRAIADLLLAARQGVCIVSRTAPGLYRVRSRRKEGHWYVVRTDRRPFTCSCPRFAGWRDRQDDPDFGCKHAAIVAVSLGVVPGLGGAHRLV